MTDIIVAILKSAVSRYAGYASALGMIGHGLYEICGDPAGDPTLGVKTVLMGFGALVALHHVTGVTATLAPVAEAASK